MPNDNRLSATEMIIRDLKLFLKSGKPGVMCIRGRWGVGKSFAWNRAITESAAEDGITLKTYSRATLFGVKSLDELKYSIFQNRMSGKAIGNKATTESFLSEYGDLFDKGLKTVAERVGGKGIGEIIEAGAFLSVKNQIVCIDDIERKGKDLRTVDVLGLASLLREERDCQVVLILNDERLEDEKAELSKYQEKVIEQSYLYAPTPAECAKIAVGENADFGSLLSKHSIALEISNIRIIRKIEAMILKVKPILDGFDRKIFDSAIHSLAVFGWAYYSEHAPVQKEASDAKKAPRNLNEECVAFIRDKHGIGRSGENLSPEETRWQAVLRALDFGLLDDLDHDLLHGVINGYFDEFSMKVNALTLTERIKHHGATKAWEKAWDTFHDSFDANHTDVINNFKGAFEQAAPYLTASEMNQLITTLKRLGEGKLAAETLEKYMVLHKDKKPDFFELRGHFRDPEAFDADIRSAFDSRSAELRNNPTVEQILISMFKNTGVTGSDLARLAAMPIDAYVSMFKSSPGENHRQLVAAALDLRKYANAPPDYAAILEKSLAALKLIAKESDLNRVRVASYGVNVDE